MKIRVSRINIFAVDIPFKTAFEHAEKRRTNSESIFIKLEMENGEAGFGESLPRPYVTGESQQSVMKTLNHILPGTVMGKTFNSFTEVVEFCSSFEGLKGAARCATELALLDSSAKTFNCSVAEAMGGVKTERIRYSGAIGSDSIFNAKISALKFKLYGLKDIKLKVGDKDDIERLKAVRTFAGKSADIRLDANGAWSAEEAIEKLTIMRDFNFSTIEQPVRKKDIDSLKKISDAFPESVMADESLCDIENARKLANMKACDMFNIRISKCGGILNSLKIAQIAKQASISYQLGCHVGETGILSAAGRHFASCVEDVRYLEGSYARFLLVEDIVKEDVSFGYGGFARPLKGKGLGVTVDEHKLGKYVKDRVIIQ